VSVRSGVAVNRVERVAQNERLLRTADYQQIRKLYFINNLILLILLTICMHVYRI